MKRVFAADQLRLVRYHSQNCNKSIAVFCSKKRKKSQVIRKVSKPLWDFRFTESLPGFVKVAFNHFLDFCVTRHLTFQFPNHICPSRSPVPEFFCQGTKPRKLYILDCEFTHPSLTITLDTWLLLSKFLLRECL